MKPLLLIVAACATLIACDAQEEPPDLNDQKSLEKTISKASAVQARGKEGEEVFYAVNSSIPFTGWGKAVWLNGQVITLVQL